MTQPISSYRPDRSQDAPDSSRPTPPATRVAAPQPPLPELPDVDASLVAKAVKAATSGAAQAPHMLLAMNVKGADIECTTRDTLIQQRLDAFKQSATPTFHVNEGTAASSASSSGTTLPVTCGCTSSKASGASSPKTTYDKHSIEGTYRPASEP